MSFTIEDMMLTSEKRYEMKFLAGKNGWANSISWVHLLEDTTIIQNFWGKEVAVTTGLGFPEKEDWMRLARKLNRYHASGLIINVGQYIREIPEELMAYCDERPSAADRAVGGAVVRHDKGFQYPCLCAGQYG